MSEPVAISLKSTMHALQFKGKAGWFCALQEMIETYLRPLRAHDWDRGALLSFRAMKRPEALPYKAVTQPVLLVIGSQDRMLLKSTQKV